jgi:hypothetical protein
MCRKPKLNWSTWVESQILRKNLHRKIFNDPFHRFFINKGCIMLVPAESKTLNTAIRPKIIAVVCNPTYPIFFCAQKRPNIFLFAKIETSPCSVSLLLFNFFVFDHKITK